MLVSFVFHLVEKRMLVRRGSPKFVQKLWEISNRQLCSSSQVGTSSKVRWVPGIEFGPRKRGLHPGIPSSVCQHDWVSFWKVIEFLSFFFMSKRTVGVIIGDMLFNPDKIDTISKATALRFFKLCESRDANVNSGKKYSVVIKLQRDFHSSLKPLRLVLLSGWPHELFSLFAMRVHWAFTVNAVKSMLPVTFGLLVLPLYRLQRKHWIRQVVFRLPWMSVLFIGCLSLMFAFGFPLTAKCTTFKFWNFLYSIGKLTWSCLKRLPSSSTRYFQYDVISLLLSQVMAIVWWRIGFKMPWLDLQQNHCLNCSEFGVVSISSICRYSVSIRHTSTKSFI